jgi:hypothetical protein
VEEDDCGEDHYDSGSSDKELKRMLDCCYSAPAFAACGRSREERPTGLASKVKQQDVARGTLDDSLPPMPGIDFP